MTEKKYLNAVARLKTVAYTEYEEDPARAWALEPFELSQINLIVGLNATGKSRVLRVLNGLARSIDGSRQLSTLDTGHYTATFLVGDENKEVVYEFAVVARKITLEKLSLGDEVLLSRDGVGKSQLWFHKNEISIEVQIPTTHLAISSRRDANQHPFFEPLHAWANTIKYCEFSKLEMQQLSAFEGKTDPENFLALPLQESFHLLVKTSKERFGHSFNSAVLNDMRRLGYHLEGFGLKPAIGINIPLATRNAAQTIFVREKDIEMDIQQAAMSNGMIRALAALVFLHTCRLNKNRDCLIIDDIGEGLDYDRSTKLIKILTEEAEKGFLQLVMTTNDRFVMNAVSVQWWSVIQREQGRVEVFNAKNSIESFEEFEKWGFNNFDFFAKRLYSKSVKKQ